MVRTPTSVRINLLCSAALVLGLVLAFSASAQDCLMCHTAAADKAVHAVFMTAHGRLDGGGTAACQSCHGASPEHAAKPGSNPPEYSFGPRWAMPVETANAACLTCHRDDGQLFWLGSEHEQEDTRCTDCHQSHVNQDPVLSAAGELDNCLQCHSQVEAQMRLPSRHPILEGKTRCSDCHNPHGSSTDAALLEPTLNDQCYSCHEETRGPYLWEHPPVTEDCSLCHESHGSVNEQLLTTRGPFLCQQCHSAAFHPSLANTGSTANNRSSNQNLLGKNCLNCHSQVHGSNHPSGSRLTR